MGKSPLSQEEINRRIDAARKEGMQAYTDRGGFSTENAFYLSFANHVNGEGVWLGGCYIRADTLNEAMVLSHVLKINPGGSVRSAGPFPAKALVSEYEHRLLTTQEELNKGLDENLLT